MSLTHRIWPLLVSTLIGAPALAQTPDAFARAEAQAEEFNALKRAAKVKRLKDEIGVALAERLQSGLAQASSYLVTAGLVADADEFILKANTPDSGISISTTAEPIDHIQDQSVGVKVQPPECVATNLGAALKQQ